MAEEGDLSFWGHLEAFRHTLFRILIALAVCVAGAFAAMPHIFDSFILGPASSDFFLYRWMASFGTGIPFLPDFGDSSFSVDIININVASQFMTHISVSFWAAFVVAFPYIIYELWKFVRPALYPNEIRNLRTAFVSGTVMFYIGCAVGYCVVFPFTFRFLAEYRLGESIVNQINLSSYMGTFITMVFVMGLVFELPLLAWLLSKLGLVNRGMLIKYRKHAVVVLMVLAAVITPTGDPFTLMVVFLPLYLLYAISVRVVRE